MRVVTVEARWDDEVEIWYASSSSDRGIVTEAPTIEALRERLRLLIPDFLETEQELRIDLRLSPHPEERAKPASRRMFQMSRERPGASFETPLCGSLG